MFEEVRLVTRSDHLVGHVIIPHFNPPAEVLIWGERCFVYAGEYRPLIGKSHRMYREGMMWPVLPQEQYRGLEIDRSDTPAEP